VVDLTCNVNPLQEKRKDSPVNVTAPKTAANSVLPLLVTLLAARKQARWQWKHCADEHKHAWQLVVYNIDERIKQGEKHLEGMLDLYSFRLKREVVE
jgi:hypothetical protein